jgi:hypothetical protein
MGCPFYFSTNSAKHVLKNGHPPRNFKLTHYSTASSRRAGMRIGLSQPRLRPTQREDAVACIGYFIAFAGLAIILRALLRS